LSNGLASNANSLYGTLAPELTQEVMNPRGFTPTEKAAMNTAGRQSAGGSMAGAVGQGGLKAARTRNAGGSDAAIQESARNAGEEASNAALKTEMADTGLKEHERESGLSGLEGLTNSQTGASIGALGIVPQAVNADTNAQNASWDWSKYLLDPAMSAAGNSFKYGG